MRRGSTTLGNLTAFRDLSFLRSSCSTAYPFPLLPPFSAFLGRSGIDIRFRLSLPLNPEDFPRDERYSRCDGDARREGEREVVLAKERSSRSTWKSSTLAQRPFVVRSSFAFSLVIVAGQVKSHVSIATVFDFSTVREVEIAQKSPTDSDDTDASRRLHV